MALIDVMLQELEREAQRRGRGLSLETGARFYFQPAHSLYRKFHFTECESFGEYRPDPNSLFLKLTF